MSSGALATYDVPYWVIIACHAAIGGGTMAGGWRGRRHVQRLEQQGHEIVIVDIETNYGLIPHDELSYLLKERKKKIATNSI